VAGQANLIRPAAVFFAVCAEQGYASLGPLSPARAPRGRDVLKVKNLSNSPKLHPFKTSGTEIPGQPPATKRPSNPAEDVRAVDLELAQRCRHGDAAAFEELYRAHAGRLYNLVFRMVGSAQEAEDLLQDVFLNAYRKLGSFRGDSSLGTWLYRLAVNQCLDVLRGRQSKMARVTDSLDDEGADEPAAASPVVPTAVSRLDLDRAIARLPQGCRAAFILHDVEGFEHNEVAKLLGVSEGTSKSQVHKARMKLRGMLSGTGQ
jgi:RNA polymerase sigma-70 factor, ECF subfamily